MGRNLAELHNGRGRETGSRKKVKKGQGSRVKRVGGYFCKKKRILEYNQKIDDLKSHLKTQLCKKRKFIQEFFPPTKSRLRRSCRLPKKTQIRRRDKRGSRGLLAPLISKVVDKVG